MDIEVIKKLANMARIDIDEKEMKEIGDSFGPILSYVGQIQEVSDTLDSKHGDIINAPINVFRDDVATNTSGEYTDKILNQAPHTEDGFLKVKKIM